MQVYDFTDAEMQYMSGEQDMTESYHCLKKCLKNAV